MRNMKQRKIRSTLTSTRLRKKLQPQPQSGVAATRSMSTMRKRNPRRRLRSMKERRNTTFFEEKEEKICKMDGALLLYTRSSS